MALIERFERLLAEGRDNALLRFSLGGEYLKAAAPDKAIEHLRAAVGHDDGYSAAWKLLGHALRDLGDADGARIAWRRGIVAAEGKGDKQAAREMAVFLRRLDREAGPADPGT